MARQGFKRAWTRIVPDYLERSVYVLAASAALIVMFLFWRPIPTSSGTRPGPRLELPIWILFSAGWLIVLLSTFLINHFELFGLQQAWFHVAGRRRKRRASPARSSTDGSRIRSISASSSPSGRRRR